jgi:TP901 family phage tail tape measure protein
MANIQLNIVGLGDFSNINTQLKYLQTQIAALQKSLQSVGIDNSLKNTLVGLQNDFKKTMLAAGNFTEQTVKLSNAHEEFAKKLQTGKLSLNDYYNIISKKSSDATRSVQALAVEQVKLNNSIVSADVTQKGVFSVYTPTKINEIAKATEIATAKQHLFNIALQEGGQKLLNFGKNTQWAGRQLTVGLTVPVVLFGQQVSKTFLDVNNELTRLQKVYGTGLTQPTKQAIDQISAQVKGLSVELAKTMGIAAKDTAAMAADLAATGKTGNDLLVATREAMRLTKLGELDTQSAMQATVSLQNVYKLSTQDLTKAVDFLNAVENQTSTSLQDLVDGIPRVGPIVQQLGGSFKDTAVMMVAMKEAGVPAAQSANAIKSAIASLINPTKAAKDAFAAYNINLANVATANGGNPVKMIMSLQQALKGLNPLAQAQLIEKLFGKFQEARIQALISNLGAVGSQTKTAFDLVNASAPQLAALAAGEMKVATESTSGKFKRAVESIKADLLPIGEQFTKIMTSVINFGDKLAKAFDSLPQGAKFLLEVLVGLTVLAGPITMVVGLFANLFGNILKGVGFLRSLRNGTAEWSSLMTPAGIASREATNLLNTGLMTDISATESLALAIRNLTAEIERMAMASRVAAETAIIPGFTAEIAGVAGIGKKPGKFASGGYVPGKTSDGDVFPALLTGGEAVIPAGPAQTYAPFIGAMISGNLPRFARGTKGSRSSTGKPMEIALAHAAPEHDSEVLNILREQEFTNMQQGRLDTINAATRGSLYTLPSMVNQETRGGAAGLTGKEIAALIREQIELGTSPLTKQLDVANKIGADTKKAEEGLSTALEKMLKELETSKANTRFGSINRRTGVDLSAIEAERQGQEHGGTFESYMGSHMSPASRQVTAVGRSGRVWNLEELQNNFIGTRGEGAGRTSATNPGSGTATTGRGYFIDPQESGQKLSLRQRIKVWSQSRAARDFPGLSQSDYAPDFSTSGSGAYAGVKDVQALPRVKGQVKQITEEIVKEGDKGLGNQSPSWKGEKSGRFYIKGIHKGIKEEATIDKPWWQAQGKEISEEIGDGISHSTSQSSLESKFSKAFGPNSRLGKFKEKMSNMSTGTKIGASMLGSMAMQMAAPTINKALGPTGGAIANDAMQMGSMGMAFGPWGALAGATIGGVVGLIKHLNEVEKEHKAESEADWKSSAEAVQFFGGSVADLTHHLNTWAGVAVSASKANNSLAQGMAYTNAQFDAFTKMVDKLPKDNPLSLVTKQLKETSDQNSAKKIAEDFAQMQMALNGISQSQANALTQMLLTMSGHNAMGAGVSAADQVSAIKNSLQASKGNFDQFSIFIGQLTNLAVNTNSWQQYKDIIDAIGSSAVGAKSYVDGLIRSLIMQGDIQGSKNVEALSGQGFSPEQIQDIFTAGQLGISVDTTGGNKGFQLNVPDLNGKAGKQTLELENQIQIAMDRKTKSQNAANSAVSAGTVAATKNVKALQEQKKALDATIKSLEDALKTRQAETNWESTRQDLKNQILMAQANGDNLKAELLQQELINKQSDYSAQKVIDQKKSQSDALGQQITDMQTAMSNAVAPATAKLNQIEINTRAKPGEPGAPPGVATVNTGQTISGAIGFGTVQDVIARFPKADFSNGQLPPDPQKWNDGNWGSANSTRQSIKELAKVGNLKKGDYFKMTAPDGDYVFQVQDDGNVHMIKTPKQLAEYNKKYPGKAKGGPVKANSTYWVGEKGPEKFVPKTDGVIVPHEKSFDEMSDWELWKYGAKASLEVLGVLPILRTLQGKKDSNWQYLGDTTGALTATKIAGKAFPSPLKYPAVAAEIIDVIQGMMEQKSDVSEKMVVHAPITIHAQTGASAEEIARIAGQHVQAVLDKKVVTAKMSGTISSVGGHR